MSFAANQILFELPGYRAIELLADNVPTLQKFLEDNSEYFLLMEGCPPATNQAAAIDPEYRGNGLQVAFTVEDPNVFTTAWSGFATYSKADDLWTENVCAENTFEYYNNRDTAVPQANKPDF